MQKTKKILISLGIFSVFTFGFLLAQFVSAEENLIPTWIKNTAKPIFRNKIISVLESVPSFVGGDESTTKCGS